MLEESQKSRDIQEAAMQQWVNITEWESEISEDKSSLDIRFKVVNPTKFPLTIINSEMVFGLPGFTSIRIIDPGLRLVPDTPQPVRITMAISPQEALDFTVGTGIDFSVRIGLLHTDLGPKRETPVIVSGYLTCQNGRGNTRFDATAKITI